MYMLYLLYSLVWISVNSSVIDQRQTGDLNVQVDFKDVQIFAVLKGDKEEYVDYDYTYDYSELTIKPQNRTTPRPLNGTSLSTTQINTISDTTTLGTTLIQENTTTAEDFITTTMRTSENDFKTTTKYSLEMTSHVISQKNVTAIPTFNTTIKNCKRGFVLNQRGDCQLKLNSTGNALMKLVKLSQKLKLRRENKSNDNP